MSASIYRELVDWYPLLDPASDHLDEATAYRDALVGAASPAPETLLELGSGAGGNAWHLKQRFRCTLSDVSEEMLGLSRRLNPECEHVAGDMRTLRLGRSFDAVLVHDAITYMTREADLRAAIQTAFEHTRPGGAALFAPDVFRENYRESTELHCGSDGERSLRCLEWDWDPDPSDSEVRVEYAFLLRDSTGVRSVHDSHRCGVFARATWIELLRSAGFEVALTARPLDEDGAHDEVFICRRGQRS
jgi:hypothetical protein